MVTRTVTQAALTGAALLLVNLPLYGNEASAGETLSPAAEVVVPFELEDDIARWARRLAPAELSPLRRLRVISQALLDPQQLGLREDLTRTPTATEAYRTRRSNCVGFAALFVGLAREAGVPAFFVMVDDLGRSRQENGLRVTEGHLAAAYGPPDRLRIFDFAGETDGGDYRVSAVTDLTAIALFYSNRGVESMLEDRNEEALHWLQRAVELDPALASARINLGVALRRTGDLEGAEEAYQEALRIDPGAAAAYRSLAALLRLRGRSREAQSLMADAELFTTEDALSYLSLARRSLETGDVDEARSLYRKALDLSRQRSD
ncbi:MAG: tetratricopeptide repeat protein [Acidobacteriota bacterium]